MADMTNSAKMDRLQVRPDYQELKNGMSKILETAVEESEKIVSRYRSNGSTT